VIRWTTPVSRKRITYQTERVGTTKLRRVIVQNTLWAIMAWYRMNFTFTSWGIVFERNLATIMTHLLCSVCQRITSALPNTRYKRNGVIVTIPYHVVIMKLFCNEITTRCNSSIDGVTQYLSHSFSRPQATHKQTISVGRNKTLHHTCCPSWLRLLRETFCTCWANLTQQDLGASFRVWLPSCRLRYFSFIT